MIVILTALELEYAAVAARMTTVEPLQLDAGTWFEVGRMGPAADREVALAGIGVGTGSAAAITALAIARLRPEAVLFVGVAGGLRDWLRIGDVVVATRVYSYHGARNSPGRVSARPRAWDASHRLEQAARYVSRRHEWYSGPPERPSVHFDPIAAGDELLDDRDSALARRLRDHYDDAVAVEMESSGVAQAGHLLNATPTLTMRGISDFADGGKQRADDGGSQHRAADNAAAFCAALVAHLPAVVPEPGGTPAGKSPPVTTRDQARPDPGDSPVVVSNNASGNARVVVQAGTFSGVVSVGEYPARPAAEGDPSTGSDPSTGKEVGP
ncbi:MAG: 5'-methylthioadenosine/S-adenosylhomocysteine nucleosidase [Saccharothrix sp.]|nr:5'-methylthioadenosine/S-adenosylhomocysteine nucleosidase [Saccharothrix sp.]